MGAVEASCGCEWCGEVASVIICISILVASTALQCFVIVIKGFPNSSRGRKMGIDYRMHLKTANDYMLDQFHYIDPDLTGQACPHQAKACRPKILTAMAHSMPQTRPSQTISTAWFISLHVIRTRPHCQSRRIKRVHHCSKFEIEEILPERATIVWRWVFLQE